MRRKIRKAALIGLAVLAFYGVSNTEVYRDQRDYSLAVQVHLPTGWVGHASQGFFYCNHGEC